MSDNRLVFAILPPFTDNVPALADRLREDVPGLEVACAGTEADVPAMLERADAALGWIPPGAVRAAKRIRWLQCPFAAPFAGYYHQELIDHPVVITNLRGIYSDHIAHHILMFMLALSRGLPYWMDAQRTGRWTRDARKHGYRNIVNSTVLIHGVGGIGAETARLCAAMGARIIGIDARREHDCPGEIHPPSHLDTVLPDADFVVTTVPHTPETELMWNSDRFARMKPEAYFINIGRGMTTSLDDLVAALANGTIAGAGLDVFEIEPLPDGHPLWSMENVILTPHIAVADAQDLAERRYRILVANARRFVAGEPLDSFENVVDKAAWY